MKIALIGEAWGAEEAQWKRPFVGPAGQELNRMLAEAGILREECFITNVFNFRPVNNDIESICVSKTDAGKDHPYPALVRGKYLRTEYFNEVTRLRTELETIAPNIAVALGNTACWALLRNTMISKLRGAVATSTLVKGLKVLPTYHPAAILRQYDLRAVTVMDLAKAKRQSEFPEIRRPVREIWYEPTLQDLDTFSSRFIAGARRLSFDIETASGQITCIGFAPDESHALVVPFTDVRKPGVSYWSLADELKAWDFVARTLALPVPKLAQNGLYDIQYLWMQYGIPVANFAHDTMLLHHALHPESPKGLDFLGSVYTDEVAWKTMRPRGKHTIKRED